MSLKLFLAPISQYYGIASGFGKVEDHGLVEELESLNLLERPFCRFDIFEYHKCLAFGFEILLRHNIDHVAIFGEDTFEGFS